MTKDLYSILGVDKKADDVEIRKAYRRLARRYHPDVSEEPDAEEKFKDVQQAYEVLKDPERRAHYDATGGVDSETINPPRDILMSIMKDALIFAINIPTVNIAATIQQGLDDSQDNINKRIAVLKDALRHMKRLRNSVRRKKEGQLNLFHVVVDREITVVTDLVEEKLPALLKHLMEARRMYKDYERGEASDFETAILMIGRTHK